MNRTVTQASSIVAALLFVAGTAAAQDVSADQILKTARENAQRQQTSFRAQLRDDDGNKTPFTISMDRGTVNYDFQNPDQRIQLVIAANGSELREGAGDKTKAVKPARYDQKVRGTLVTYEDLAMRPLYWPKAKLLGEETILARRTWKLEAQAPAGQSQYGVARLWIDKQSGAALRIEAYSKDGNPRKFFKATAAQPIDGQWMLKTMRIENFDPVTHRRAGLMYLDVLGKAEKP